VAATEGCCEGAIDSGKESRTSPEEVANTKTAVKASTKAAKKGAPMKESSSEEDGPGCCTGGKPSSVVRLETENSSQSSPSPALNSTT
jgi:hypothetical protein